MGKLGKTRQTLVTPLFGKSFLVKARGKREDVVFRKSGKLYHRQTQKANIFQFSIHLSQKNEFCGKKCVYQQYFPLWKIEKAFIFLVPFHFPTIFYCLVGGISADFKRVLNVFFTVWENGGKSRLVSKNILFQVLDISGK